MTAASGETAAAKLFRLQRPVDPARDHVRGGAAHDTVTVVLYGDFLCPYCRRLIPVLARLREALGDRLRYVFRHFPNESAHPGATLAARATEAAGRQGKFWPMYDRVFAHDLPVGEPQLLQIARDVGLDVGRFTADLSGEPVLRSVDEDIEEGGANGVTGTPTLFVDGVRYDGAWDFYSMLEAMERPIGARFKEAGRVFANLPASGGLVLLIAALAAIVCSNSPLRYAYRSALDAPMVLGMSRWLEMSVGEWCSEGLLAIFFLLVGLEIRREVTAGALADRRAAALPVLAAVGGTIAPALIYLAINRHTPEAVGWSVPTATDVAFPLGILALLGRSVPTTLRVFVAALAVADDVLSVLVLAVFFPHSLQPIWLVGTGSAVLILAVLNRWRVFALWPYGIAAIAVWYTLHQAGVHAALAGVLLAAFLPTQPVPAAGPLLAQAATALAALEHAEHELAQSPRSAHDGPSSRVDQEPIWDWASRNLSAASERLLSPAERLERVLSPWSSYVVLPLFAFSATGVPLQIDWSNAGATRILAGVVAGLVVGKPAGIATASWIAVKSAVAVGPRGVTVRQFVGAACLCGVADTVALLMADQAGLPGSGASIAKIGCLVGSCAAAALGTLVLALARS
jgi:NhaA family Na+:H+ antiporter